MLHLMLFVYRFLNRPSNVTIINLIILVECRMGKGQYYLGNVNRTKSGIPCQRWDAQEPHDHIQPPLVFPQIMDGENYCRNAGGEEAFPWCYTVDKTVRWQHCDIPLCGKS